MKSYLWLSLILLFGMTCGNNVISEEGEEFGNTDVTEAILYEKSEHGITNYSRKTSKNLVDLLYNEALVQDNELKVLDNSIRTSLIKQQKIAALYVKHQFPLDEFKDRATKYPQLIRDSLIQSTASSLSAAFIEGYKNTSRPIKQLHQKSLTQISAIKDYHRLLRLSTAIKMMEKYLKEEVPALDEMKENLIEQKNLINQIQNHLKEKE